MYNLNVKTAPTSEPVTEAVMKNYIKYDESDATEINLINSMLTAAREMIEAYTGRSLTEKTYTLEFDYLVVNGDSTINIPRGPVVSVSSLKYYEDGQDEAELTVNLDYYLRGGQWKEVYFPSLNSWGYYILEYISGHGATETEAVPETLKIAICETVFDWYENRGQGKDWKIPPHVITKIAAYTKHDLI